MSPLVLSGARTIVPSGAADTCYQAHEPVLSSRHHYGIRARNESNQDSFGVFLTDRACGLRDLDEPRGGPRP